MPQNNKIPKIPFCNTQTVKSNPDKNPYPITKSNTNTTEISVIHASQKLCEKVFFYL